MNPLSRRLSRILGSSTPWVFLISAVALGLLTNGLSTWITEQAADGRRGGAYTAAIGAILLILMMVLFNLPRRLRQWFDRLSRPQSQISLSEQIPPRRALVALVSRGPQGSPQTRQAIQYYINQSAAIRLKYCWLIAGPGEGENSSRDNAARLEAEFEPQGIDVDIIELADVEDAKAAFEAVAKIYEATPSLGLSCPDDIIADFTAGSKPMTAGMALACAAHGWPMQYMRADRFDAQGRATKDAKAVPTLVRMDFFAPFIGQTDM